MTEQTPQQAEGLPQPEEEEESTATHDKLLAFLTTKDIPYELSTHEACRTSEESAAARGVPLETGAKAILIKDTASDNVFCLAVMSASHRFSSKQFKKCAGRKKIRFATTQEVKEITGCLPGAVPPFGSIYKDDPTSIIIQVFVDRSLSRQSDIYFNCGLRTSSIKMTYADYIMAEEPQAHGVVFTEQEMELGD